MTTTMQHFSINPAVMFAKVADDREPCVIERTEGNIVMLMQTDYDSLMETVHQLSSAANVVHLQTSMSQADAKDYAAVDIDNLWK